MEATNWLGYRGVKGATKDCFIFSICFAPNILAESMMNVGAYMCGMFKTNTKGLCKYIIDNMINYCPGGSYLALKIKSVVPGDRPLIYISYKYNAWNVLSFIATYYTLRKNYGITYLSNCPDLFGNVSICHIARTPFIYKLF